ncbi:uncharacterized protein [Anas platyrhynchos]|uniref:uncharacterized protein isoform X4 n=1 Tax=Anas platyrhynchos TaxID=8839 RepID=UPI003AF2124F
MGARGGRGLSVSAAMAARPGGGGGARPVPATAAAASLPAASRLPVRKAHAKRAAAAPEPEAPEQKRRRSGPRAGWAPSSRAPLRAISVPTAPGPGLLRKAMTVAAAPQAGKKAPGAASGSAAPPPVPGVRRRAAGDPRGQLAELREKIRGLEDDNRQLREQLQHSRAREEELEGQVSSLRTELQQSQEERSRWQREAEAQAAERQRLAAELQERHRQLEELREAARDREEQLGAAQAELRALAGAQEEHLHALEMERRRLHNQLQELKGNIRVFCCVRPLLAAEQEAQKGLEHLHFPPEDNKTLVLCRTEGSHTGRRGEGRYDFSFDRVFPPGASQEDVFEEIALLVQSALDGYPVCIFAYGQTGSGKTYTMEGPGGADPTSWGVIPRAVRHLFGGARQLEHKGWQSALDGYPVCIFAYGQTGSGKTYTMEGPGGADPTSWGVIPRAVRHLFGGARQLEHKGWQYSFSASFLEIYNEVLRDLLGGDKGGELEVSCGEQAIKELVKYILN